MSTTPACLNVSPLAAARGERLVAFLERRPMFITAEDFMTYLRLRNVKRYRITVLPNADIIFELPAHKLRVMHDAQAHRAVYSVWMVKPLPWWRWGMKVAEDTRIKLVR